MSLDQQGREAGSEVRREAVRGVLTMSMYEELRSTDVRRRWTGAMTALVAGLLVVGLGWRAVAAVDSDRQSPAQPRPASTAAPSPRATVNLEVPFSVVLPPGWYDVPVSMTTTDIYSDTYRYGFSVYESVRAAAFSAQAHVAAGAGTDARSLAGWVAGRPFLESSDVTGTTVSGLPAWEVDVQGRPGTAQVARQCGYGGNLSPCSPLLLLGSGPYEVLGVDPGGENRYVFVDLPDGRVLLLSAWDFASPSAGFDRAAAVIASVRFANP